MRLPHQTVGRWLAMALLASPPQRSTGLGIDRLWGLAATVAAAVRRPGSVVGF